MLRVRPVTVDTPKPSPGTSPSRITPETGSVREDHRGPHAIPAPARRPSVLFQTNPLGRLLRREGDDFYPNNLEGTLSLADLYRRGGDSSLANYIGLGTLDGLNGELVIVGAAWLVDVEGNARQLTDLENAKTPFAMAVRFSPRRTFTDRGLRALRGLDMAGLFNHIDHYLVAAPGKYHAIKMVVEAGVMHTKNVRPPERNDRPLSEFEKRLTSRAQSYTVAGFRVPDAVDPLVNFPGHHFHAINNIPSRQGTDGGHILNFTIGKAHYLGIQEIDEVEVMEG